MGRAFESIRAGLEQAVDHARGEPVRAVVHEIGPLDVKAIRDRLDMSQTEFAASFGISVGTLRHWERGARRPRGPARVLLNVLAKEPETVLRILRS